MSFSQQEDDIDNDIALLQQVQNALLMAQQARNQNDNVIRQKVKATLRQTREQLALPAQRLGHNTPTLSRTFSGSSSASTILDRHDSVSTDISLGGSSDTSSVATMMYGGASDSSTVATIPYVGSKRSRENLDEDSQVWSDVDDEEENPKPKPKPKKRRKKSQPQLKADRRLVAGPVLRQLDTKYLAALRSPLFRRRYKKQHNPDGSRSLKKNADIVIKFFNRLIKPILQSILGDAAMKDKELVKRYYDAALVVVKKRRANHLQEWRLKGRSMPLRYDPMRQFALTKANNSWSCPINPINEPNIDEPKQKKKCQVTLDFDDDVEESQDDVDAPIPEAQSQDQDVVDEPLPESQSQDQDVVDAPLPESQSQDQDVVDAPLPESQSQDQDVVDESIP